MSNREPKPKNSTTSRITAVRGRVLLIAVLVCMLALCVRFAYLQVFDPNDYRIAALDQYTNSVTIPAKRGTIYASDGTTELATSATVYNCFISPVDLDEDDALLNKIATELSAILDVDKETVVSKGKKTKSKYQIIKKFLTDTEETAVRNLIKENSQSTANTSLASGSSIAYSKIIHLEETTKRYYRYGSLAAQLIGFTGTDNQGLTGIEANYNEYLAGVNGKSVKAADAYGNELETGVGSSYIPATDGLNIVTTIDWSVQNSVEKYIKQAYEEHKPNGRVECIVMNVTNGEILASAIYPSYDLNNYSDLNEEYQKLYDLFIGTEEERADYKKKLMYEMWNNTLVTQTYEPGSTFKMITSAMALEEGIVDPENTILTCVGACNVAGTTIHCHQISGHGSQTFSQALVNSCNPAFVYVGTSVGTTLFKKYFEEFGYTKPTGSNITGEASTIYFGTTGTQFEALELAVYSFGQTFKVTPLQHIRALSAVANGGRLVVPHTVKSLVDNYGNVVKTFEYASDRQVISAQTSETICRILTNSTKNACVSGYNVISKTGTSEKRDTERKDDYISSCVTFAPAEDPQIAILVLVDEPTQGKHFGGQVAAPIVSNILSEVLPHLGIAPDGGESETVKIPDYRTLSVENAKSAAESAGLKCIVKGSGERVVDQMPRMDSAVTKDGVVILYTSGADVVADVSVPDLKGKTPTAAIKALLNSNLNVKVSGIFNNDYKNCHVKAQSVDAGEKVYPGTVITIEFIYEESIE